MAQIFPRGSNQIIRVGLILVILVTLSTAGLAYLLDRSSLNTKQGTFVHQDVPFSHHHHVAAIGIDCRYCHTSVEESAFAGIPPTATCMNCHKQIWADADMLAPVRESYATGKRLVWTRVNDLPDYVYFNHSIHVSKGIGCQTCHGRVDAMPLMYQARSLQMRWCLDCHRHPEPNLRPRAEVVSMTWEPEEDPEALAKRLAEQYDVARLENCSTCHR